jgi:hypothetical protein
MEYGSRDIYHIVLGVAAIPVLGFVIWLSWVITNKLMSPDWQRKKRAKEIRKAMEERAALMAELHAEDRRALPEQDK